MTRETLIALLNYDSLVRYKGLDRVELAWESDTLVYGDGGVDIDILCEPGFTGATDGWSSPGLRRLPAPAERKPVRQADSQVGLSDLHTQMERNQAQIIELLSRLVGKDPNGG